MTGKTLIKEQTVVIDLLHELVKEKIDNALYDDEKKLEISGDTELLKSGIIDSFDLVEIITATEVKLDIKPDFENIGLKKITIFNLARAFASE